MLAELETCPRRWALKSAQYPEVWARHGYPPSFQRAAVEGTVIHMSLETVMRALAAHECPSVQDASAIAVLRGLRGLSAVVADSIKHALTTLKRNPRVAPRLPAAHRTLSARVGDLRLRVQTLLSRVRLEPRRAAVTATGTSPAGVGTQSALSDGSYAEVELTAPDLEWCGVADLVTLTADAIEIRDFKTGKPRDEHRFQLHAYAVLWWRDRDRNPSARPASRLVISYDSGDVDVPAPDPDQLLSMEAELCVRTAAGLAALDRDPPEARPSTENCGYCSVRHLCDDYWRWAASDERRDAGDGFADLQVELSDRHGSRSWDGVVESCTRLRAGDSILLRTADLTFEAQSGQRLRVLNVRVSVPTDDLGDDATTPAVATMGAWSEAFLLSA